MKLAVDPKQSLLARWLSPSPLCPGDPRQAPGPSEQWVTLWPASAAESANALRVIERTKPQGVALHAVGPELAAKIPGWATRMRARFPDVKLACAVAGDWQRPTHDGANGWVDSAVAAKAAGLSFWQLNAEQWGKRAPGEMRELLLRVAAKAPGLELTHTTFGAPVNVDKRPDVAGWQGFGGHAESHYREALDGSTAVASSEWQWYTASGAQKPWADDLTVMEWYCRSVAAGYVNRSIAASVRFGVYLQAYDTSAAALCLVSQRARRTQWWCLGADGSRLDEQGARAIAWSAEQYRRSMTVAQLQVALGVEGDSLMGRRSWEAFAASKGQPATLLTP